MNRWGLSLSTGCRVIAFLMLKTGSCFVVFLYGGNIPFVVSLCFASQRTPTVCAYCAGSISTIGLRSFLLKVSGVSSHLSFCCTSLVSGFIILKTGSLVYSQTVQQLSLVFAPKVQKAGIHETRPKLSGRMCPVMSLIATVLFKEPSFGTWVHTFGCNFPMALCWQMFYCGPLSRAIFRLLFRRGEKK